MMRDSFDYYIDLFLIGGKLLNENDKVLACRIWVGLTLDQQRFAYRDMARIVKMRRPDMIPMPVNHLRSEPWERKGPGRSIPEPVSPRQAEFDRLMDEAFGGAA